LIDVGAERIVESFSEVNGFRTIDTEIFVTYFIYNDFLFLSRTRSSIAKKQKSEQ